MNRMEDTRSARSRGSRAKSINGAVALNVEDQREIIKNALNRKQISHDYHTTLPKFMKSQGPFAVYDHAIHKGEGTTQVNSMVTEQALNRHFDEVKRLQGMREGEQAQFYANIDNLDRQQAMRNHFIKINNRMNQDFIKQQIADKAVMKKNHDEVERYYYKPHFGPEETAEVALTHEKKAREMKDYLRQSLRDQLAEQKAMSEASKKLEYADDQIFLQTAAETQHIENFAQAKKNQVMK